MKGAFLIPASQLDLLEIEIEVPLRFDPQRMVLPEDYQSNPDHAINQLVDRDKGKVETAHENVRKQTGDVLAGIAVVALSAANPPAAFKRGVDRLGLPYKEAVEMFKSYMYSADPKLAPYLDGLVTSGQINGQVRGNPDLRARLEETLLTDGRPHRKAAGVIDLANAAERKALRQHSGDTLEMQVAQCLEWAGLTHHRNRPQPILKLFGERAEPDFTVVDGIEDPSGLFRDGFYIECKNRPVGRVPDTDLLYALVNICMYYPKTTIVVLDTPVDRIREAANQFMEHQRKSKALGHLRAVMSMDQFRGFVYDQIGRAA